MIPHVLGTDADMQNFSSLFQHMATSRSWCCSYIRQLLSILPVLPCWKLHADQKCPKGSPLINQLEASGFFLGKLFSNSFWYWIAKAMLATPFSWSELWRLTWGDSTTPQRIQVQRGKYLILLAGDWVFREMDKCLLLSISAGMLQKPG